MKYRFWLINFLFVSSLLISAQSVKIATWNVRILSKKRDDRAALTIAKILVQFDFISIVELRDPLILDRICILLREQFKRNFHYQLSSPVGRKVKERYCFLYDSKKVQVVVPGKVYPDPENKFIREPYYASFVSGNFDFTVIATHVIWGNSVRQRRREVRALADVFQDIQNKNPKEQDVILLGDFNRPPEDDLAFAALKSIPEMLHLFAAPQTSMIKNTYLYDNIWFQSNFVQEYQNQKGIDKFARKLFGRNRRKASKVVSDHRPVWAVFNTSDLDDD